MSDSTARRADGGRTFGRRALFGAVGAAVLAGCTATSRAPVGTPTATAPGAGPTTAPLSTPPAVTRVTVPTSAATSPPMTTTSPPTTSSLAEATGPRDFDALAKALGDRLVRPADSSFAAASELFNPRFDGVRPQAVARPASPKDVAACVAFANNTGTPLAIRSGGHCYAGWSTGPGLVIDTRSMAAVTLHGKTATVGAGASLIDVYSALAAKGVGIPGGSCPTVGIAGLTLGGGIGVVDRTWGLACDNLVAAEVVLADGSIVSCDADNDGDLLWALKGGGGGTFGVVTSLTFAARPIRPLATWGLTWPWSAAPKVIAAWLSWLPQAPDALWGSVHLSSAPGSEQPVVSVVGTYFGGDTAALAKVLAGLESAVGAAPSSRYANRHTFLDAMLIDAGCGSVGLDQCHLAPAGAVTRQAYAASSDWIAAPLPQAGIDALLGAIQERHDARGAPDVAVQLDASGGAINRIAPAATAFVHRGALCSVQYIANWYASTPAQAVTEAAAWPHHTREAMQPYVTGGAYQNYVDPQIADWQQAYFGANYPRLQQVKAAYDPGDLFRHPQGVAAP